MQTLNLWALNSQTPLSDMDYHLARFRLLLKQRQAFGSDSPCRTCSGDCCRHCAADDAYFLGTLSRRAFSELKRTHGWDSLRGFRGERGCKLPLHLRSATCVGFFCGSYDTPLRPAVLDVNAPSTRRTIYMAERLNDAILAADTSLEPV